MTAARTGHEGAPPAGAIVCAACGAPMTCGRDDPNGCWCARLPALPAETLVQGEGCLCEACLRARQAGSVRRPSCAR